MVQSAPQELWKQYVQSHHFTSFTDIMAVMKEVFHCFHVFQSCLWVKNVVKTVSLKNSGNGSFILAHKDPRKWFDSSVQEVLEYCIPSLQHIVASHRPLHHLFL